MIINPSPAMDGKSAYQYAAEGGYAGTEEEFQQLMGTGPWLPLKGGALAGPLTVPEPTASGHAVNKGYVDALVGGIEAALAAI